MNLAALRLVSQQISASHCHTPAGLVGAFGAMQAQDYRSSLWAVGLRLPGSTEAQITQAVADRAIVRTWPMRGTLHFVTAADVRWMLKLLTPRIIAGSAAGARNLELDDAVFSRCRALFTKALTGDRQRPRSAMMKLLEENGISTASQRGYHILWRLAQEGLLCFGARAGNEPTFALLDEWVRASPYLDRETALATLASRYFSSHGPATVSDFVWWSGLKVSDAKTALASISAHLTQESLDGSQYWMCSASPGILEDRACLLPAFDEYLLGYRNRSAVLEAEHAPLVVPGSNGMFLPIFLIGGRAAGTWKKTTNARSTSLTLSPFRKLKKADLEALELAVNDYGRFLGHPVGMRLSA